MRILQSFNGFKVAFVELQFKFIHGLTREKVGSLLQKIRDVSSLFGHQNLLLKFFRFN